MGEGQGEEQGVRQGEGQGEGQGVRQGRVGEGQGEGQGEGGDRADAAEVMRLYTTLLPHIMVLDRYVMFWSCTQNNCAYLHTGTACAQAQHAHRHSMRTDRACTDRHKMFV